MHRGILSAVAGGLVVMAMTACSVGEPVGSVGVSQLHVRSFGRVAAPASVEPFVLFDERDDLQAVTSVRNVEPAALSATEVALAQQVPDGMQDALLCVSD